MIKTVSLAAMLLVCAATHAAACIEPVSVVRDREIALLDTGLQAFKGAATRAVEARELRERSEALSKAGKFGEATETRHAALLAVGYKDDSSNTSGGVRVIGLAPPVPQGAEPPSAATPPKGVTPESGVVDRGSSGSWVAPSN